TQIGMGPGVIGVDLNGGLVAADGQFDVPLGEEGVTQVAVGPGVFGLDLQGSVVTADGPVEVPLGEQSGAQVIVGRRVFGVDVEGGLVAADAPRQVSFFVQSLAYVEVNAGAITPQGQRRGQIARRLLWPRVALVQQRQSQVVVQPEVARV